MSCIYAIATSSWLNVLLVIVPLAITSYLIDAPPMLVFTTNVIAVIPLSSLLTYATEALSRESGDTIGALMNVTFGNLGEIILLIAALYHDQFEVVQASILGSILVNLLLILGTAILTGSYYNHGQGHDRDEGQGLACLLSISVFSLLIPNAFYHSFNDDEAAEAAVLILSRVSSLTLLAIYVLYIFFLVRKSSATISPQDQTPLLSSRRTSMSTGQGRRLATAHSLTRSIRFQDEDLADDDRDGRRSDSLELGYVSESDDDRHDADNAPRLSPDKDGEDPRSSDSPGTGHDDKSVPVQHQSIYQLHTRYRSRSRDSLRQAIDSHRLSAAGSTTNLPRFLLGNSTPNNVEVLSNIDGQTESEFFIRRGAAVCLLFASSILVAVCAEFLVSSLDDIVSSGPLSPVFIGLIILPIAGNCAELLTAIVVAARGNFDLAIGVSVGSSVQISLFITPLVVLSGWVMHKEMTLYFGLFEIVALFATTFLVNCLIVNSRTNALEGSILCACYFIMAVGAFLFPRPEDSSSDLQI